MKTTITQNLIFRTFSRLQRSCFSAVFLLLFLLSASSSWGQIAQRGTATTNTSTTTSVTVTKPTELNVGDIMIATINQADNDDNTLGNATLTGWQLAGGAKFYSSGIDEWWGTVLYKVATASDVTAANFTFTGDGDADDMQASIIAFSGVDQTNPIDAGGTFISSTTDDTSLSANSITTTSKNAAVIMLSMISNNVNFNSDWRTTSPTSLTELFDVPFDADLNMGIGGAWAIKGTPGETGVGQVTLSANARDGAMMLALRAAGSTGFQVFNTSSNFNAPCYVTNVTVEAWGGGGGADSRNGRRPGGGGGGGAYAKLNTLTVSSANPISVTVGAGGTGGSDANINVGTGGGQSSFGTALVVNGGSAGDSQNGGNGGAVGTTGDIKFKGGDAGDADDTDDRGGSGGGAAGSFSGNGANGRDNNSGNGGAGGVGLFGAGNGGAGGNNDVNGNPGIAPGGGGGGEGGDGTSNADVAGNGGAGRVIVSWACPSATITYSNGPFCKSVTSAAVTITGTDARSTCSTTFSYTGTGTLSLDTTTGAINPSASTVGTYTVTYALPAAGGCAAVSATATVTIIDVPSLTAISAPAALCAGASLNPTTPTVTANGSTVSSQGWQLETAVGNGTFAALPVPYTVAFADNGKKIRYVATNGCGTTNGNQVTLTVNPTSVGGTVTGAATVCTGTNSTVLTLSGHTGSITRWESSLNNFSTAGTAIANTTTTLTATNLTATTSYRAVVTSGVCAAANSVSTTVTVNTTAAPTASAQTFCSGATVASLTATGTALKWYAAASGGSALTSTTALSTATYHVSQTLNSCESTRTTVSVTVNTTAAPTASAQTICSGTTVVDLVATGTAVKWYAAASGGSALVNTTALSTSTYYASQTINTCESTRIAVEVTVLISPNAPAGTNGSSTISGCPGAGVPVTVTANGNGVNVFWYAAPQGGTKLQPTASNTFSPTIAQNTIYYAQTESANGCISLTRTAVEAKLFSQTSWLGGASGRTDDWFTASNWSCGAVPNENTNVVIPTGKTVSIAYRPNQISAAAYSVTLEGTANLTVTEDHNLTVTNKVTVASGATFTVEKDASLVQTDNVANEGNITVIKSTPSNRLLKRNDAVLWSSPVVQNLRAISTGTPDAFFMEHNPQANSWSAVSSPATADFTKGKGFLVRTPSTFPTTATQQWSVNFTGVPNNGNVTISAGNTGTTEKYLLVGNPYPSAISIAAFRAANPNITGVFYFFRKPNGVTGISSYGTLSADGSFSPNDNGVGAVSPGSVIPSGQGFFVAMNLNNNGNVVFTNAMRVANNHGTFNRMNTNLDTYRLLLQTPVGGNSQFITNYDAETTSGYDVGYDAIAFTDGTTDLSMIMNAKNYRIQSRGQYNAADVIPVQFKTGLAGEHRIKLQDAQGVFAADQMVIIKDNLTGVQHNLTANGDYVFTATAGTFTNRFEVVYQQAYYTALQANSCGATIANMSSLVYADLINGATGYRFKVVNNTTSAVQTIDRQFHWFAFNMLSSYDYNTAYTISVQVQKDGVWTGYYGTTCSVTSPNIVATGVMQINPSQCGMTLPTIGTVIATTPVSGATGYKFRITNTTANASGANLVQEITRTNHWFTLSMLPRYNYGSSYTIEVAVKTTGAFTPYGNACTVYSQSAPTLTSCGQTVATSATIVSTTPMTAVTQYRFQLTRMSTLETITFDKSNHWFTFRTHVPGYAAGEQYGVRVAVMTAGAWSPYGDACDITAPIASARTTEEAAPSEANLFKPVAYPNPFANTFGISLATPSADVVHVMVYDLQGRLIEKQNIFVSQLDSLQIGSNYPSGDYLLVVAQGANIKSSHIHKD